MDALSNYNQMIMASEDKENTTFVIDKDLYCYKIISFDLKIVGATYQHLVNKVFKHQISHNMKVYVGDMLVKSMKKDWHITDLEEAFRKLRKY